jgi:DNA-binding GntR family transcriptional regulator
MNLKEGVIRELQRAITAGEYQPGEHLTEAALCERFKVSRTPIREALNQLEKEGFVKITPAAGARVVELSPQQIMDVYDLLIIMEGAASRLASGHITEEQIRKLEEYNFLFEKAVEQGNAELSFQINWQFHWLITEATRNPYLIDVRLNFRRLIDRIGPVFALMPAQVKASLNEHRRITQALKARNPALSEFLMREHLETAKKRLAAHLQQGGAKLVKEVPSRRTGKRRTARRQKTMDDFSALVGGKVN